MRYSEETGFPLVKLCIRNFLFSNISEAIVVTTRAGKKSRRKKKQSH